MNPVATRLLTRIVGLTFGLFVFTSAFSIAASQAALGISLVGFLVLYLTRNIPAYPKPVRYVMIGAALFFGWLTVAAVFGKHSVESLVTNREEWLSLIIPIGVFLMRDRNRSDWLITTFAAALLSLSAYGLIQHFTGLYLLSNHGLHTASGEYRLAGSFSHPLTFGNYVAVATLTLLGYLAASWKDLPRPRKTLLILAGVAGLITIALCNSRGPMLATGAGLLALGLLFKRVKYALIAVVAVAIVFAVVSPNVVSRFSQLMSRDLAGHHPTSRVFIWRKSAEIVRDHPLTGVGSSNFGREYIPRLSPDIEPKFHQGHAHSDFLHISAIAGFPGLLFYLALWIVALRFFYVGWRHAHWSTQSRALSLAALAGSTAFMVASLTEAVFTDEEVRQLLMFIWAVGLSAWWSQDGDKAISDHPSKPPGG